ncbi:DUF2157 domain-containing protein [Nocardioides marmoriginsengisoli]|uniref:DUF2157 domain-containing protein n=1 Tax=Nocardioides marmoriginsengisoli TaxID=661483 RepID=A0A3N0CB04_9ACTN|nr:DUF2157 domain-containing protein [Nocardioides marmoriginsengisoli]
MDRVTEALVAQGLVRPEDAERARGVVAGGLEAPKVEAQAGLPKLVEVVAYLGAALVLAAGLLFMAQTWDDLGEVGQVVAMVLVTAILGGAGLVARGSLAVLAGNEVRRRLAGTLLAGAAVTAGFAVAIAVDAIHDGSFDTYWPGFAGGLVTMLVGFVGYRLASSAAGLLAVLGGALVAAPTWAASLDEEALGVGGAFFFVGVIWLVVTESGLFAQRTIARSLGCSTAVFGAQFIALASDRHALGYVLTAGIVVGSVLMYLAQLAWPYLTAAVVGITFVVPEAVSDWTSGDLGVIGGVMVTGLTLLAASFAGYWLRREASE